MKIRLLNRDFEMNKYRINVDNFKKEKTLIGVSFKRSEMNFKKYKKLFLYLFMPYKWLNKQFERGNL